MPLLPILRFPDPRLHKVAAPVADVTPELQPLIDDMFATMYDAKGIGLAATQVDVHQRLIVIDVSDDKSTPLVLINPEITWSSPERHKGEEGCLSVPGIYDKVTRAEHIKVRALGLDGAPFEIEADGLLSVCLQHEMDHLMGIVFVEHLSRLKQGRIKSKLAKQARITA